MLEAAADGSARRPPVRPPTVSQQRRGRGPRDHLIRDSARFDDAIGRALPFARNGWIITFGMSPGRPETGYGYILRGPGTRERGPCRRALRGEAGCGNGTAIRSKETMTGTAASS